jgi:hypothetical protein
LKPVRGLTSPQEDKPAEKIPWTEHIKPLLEAAIDDASGVRVLNTLRVRDGVGTVPAIENT